MVKLTRLNNQVVVVNPDHIQSADASPDTTLRLASGERMVVKESLDELISKVVAFRQRVQSGILGAMASDGPTVAAVTIRQDADDDDGDATGGA